MSTIIYGADYNPEQWDKNIWLEDMKLMKKANVNMVNLNIFGWALIESSEAIYNFDQLDELMDLLNEHNIGVDLATGTAAQPAWLSKQYKDVLSVDSSMNTIWYGSRQSYCPNSPNYIKRMKALVRALAKRYHKHPALKMWHINNEYGDHTSICYCDQCASQFRKWLLDKYTLDDINLRWGTSFWSQKYYEMNEIIPPRQTSGDHNPGLVLDYKRFMSESYLSLYKEEAKILKKWSPKIKITTNFMGNKTKPLDYFKWAKDIDVISWDSYPDLSKSHSYILNAFTHDLMRSLKNQPFIMMEQAPNQVNWRSENPNKQPGQMAAYSMQCLAHGGSGIMFFQWRQSLKGAEKFHSGMVPHSGENSRVFREVTELGKALTKLSIKPFDVYNRVAIVMDYDNWWALEYEPGPSVKMKYMEQLLNYYTYFYENNIAVDICSYDSDFSQYNYVVCPNLYMVKEGLTLKLEAYVSCGGQLICGPFSGIVDESDTVFSTGYPGPLSELLGISIEEYDVLCQPITFEWYGKNNMANHWCDLITLKTATALGTYNEQYYKNTPAVTENNYGLGKAYFIGTILEGDSINNVLDKICNLPSVKTPDGIEYRESGGYTYIINHTKQSHHLAVNLEDLTGNTISTLRLKPFDYFIGRQYEVRRD